MLVEDSSTYGLTAIPNTAASNMWTIVTRSEL